LKIVSIEDMTIRKLAPKNMSEAGGYASLGYPSDISDEAVKEWRAQHGEARK
jgi:hypothetical protein